MQTTTKRLDSCLVWFAGVSGSLLLIFVISYAVDMWRLAKAWNEAYTLAAQLGYTQERHLVDNTSSQLAHLLLGTAGCEVQVFFTTPLDRADFALRAERSGAYRARGNPTDGRNMYLQLPFDVDGSNINMLSRDQIEELPPVYEQYWFVNNEKGQIKTAIFYSQFSQAGAAIKYDGEPITENGASRRPTSPCSRNWPISTFPCCPV
ncbi:MAG: hypothetical protein IAE81_14155, partial [Caldilineaceae bacterium]|nr:hypothetical protein [Caldilineaceae bacterium]